MERDNFRNYNDYCLLYYAKEFDEDAINCLFWKYSFLIKSKITKFNVPMYYKDDFYQEGCLILHKAIRIFDEYSRMRFTSFFDLLLTRHYISLYRKYGKLFKNQLIDDWDDYQDLVQEETISIFNEDEFDFSDFEKSVYVMYYKETLKLEDIARALNVQPKTAYNAKQRVAKKIRLKYFGR